MGVCLGLHVHEFLLLFYIYTARSFSWYKTFLYRSKLSPNKILIVCILQGTYSLTADTSDYVMIFVFILCFGALPCMIPTAQDIHPPVFPLMSSCTACDASMHVSNLRKSYYLIILWSFFVAFKQFSTLQSFPQSSLVGRWTLVHSKDIRVSKSVYDHFVIHKILAVIEW